MKKLILIMMMVSFVSFGDYLDTVVGNYDEFKKLDDYEMFKTTSQKIIKEFSGFVEIDYLAGTVDVSRALWEVNETKESKLTILTLFVIDMYEKTGSTDISVMVDYTTVLTVINGRIYTKRVF